MTDTGTRPLSGVRVLDLTRYFSGPQATLLLAGLGADVVKVDDPVSGDPAADAPPYLGVHGVSFERRDPRDLGIAYLKRARGKRSITIDLKQAAGRDLFIALAGQCDLVIENFRSGVADRLGIGWATLHERYPRLVYCALTGYGSTGPQRTDKAYDVMVQAAAGLMGVTGRPGDPPTKAGSPLADAIAGVHAALGVVAALRQRDRTGQGQFIDVSMLDCLFSMLFDEPFDCYPRLGLDFQQGNRIARFSPFNTYRSLDGWVILGAASAAEWEALLALIGRTELMADPDWRRAGWRLAHNDDVDALVSQWTATLPTCELLSRLRSHDITCGDVPEMRAVLESAQLRARNMIKPIEHPELGPLGVLHQVNVAGFPIRFSDARTDYSTPAPRIGEHTGAVLQDWLALDPIAIEALREQGVLGRSD